MTGRKPIDGVLQQQAAVSPPATKACLARRPWLLALVLVVTTFVAYQPVWHAGFIWDDDDLITQNPMIRASDGLQRIWFTTQAKDYYPLTWSLCWLEWRFWGNRAVGYHVVNILLHAANALLVWTVLRRLKIRGAWLAGLVFAIHPVNVATVAWVSEQKNTLSMLFYAVAILLYLRFDEENHWRWYGLSLGAFLLALFSKTAVVMLPVVLLGCVWWRRGRVGRQDLLRSVPFFVLSLVLGLATIWFEYSRELGGHMTRTDGFPSHLAVAGLAPWFYLYKAFLPFNLSLIYPKWHINPSSWISYLPGMALVGCLTLFWWKRQTWGRPLLFALGYFVVTLFPVLGFFDQAFYMQSLVADHWQYYSIIGPIALAIGAGAVVCRRTGSRRRYWGTVAAVAVLTVLGAATWQRGRVYATEEALWTDTVAKNPNNSVAHHNLGNALLRVGRVPEAIGHYEQALRIKPNLAETRNSLGLALVRLGRVQEAIRQYQQALRIKPDLAEAHNNLGAALIGQGRVPEAIGHYEQALQLKPNYADAHKNLGDALLRAGRVQEAIGHYEQALRLKPDSAGARFNLGTVLEQAGQPREAIKQYEEVLRIKPESVEAQNNLAWLLATRTAAEGGSPAQGLGLARRVCELTGNQVPPYLDTLAAAYAATGQFSNAVATAQQAIDLARAAGQPQIAREIQMRLDLYRSGQAFHYPAPDATSPPKS